MKMQQKVLIATALGILASPAALALKNPAAVYCEALGFAYETVQTKQGSQGLCRLPELGPVDAWAFLRGEIGARYSICVRKGFKGQSVKDGQVCRAIYSARCMVCLTPEGPVEATQLMQLDFSESRCGDGRCGMPENHKTCPKDCPSGSADRLCDGNKDAICDPDCKRDQDPDCMKPVVGKSDQPIHDRLERPLTKPVE